MIQRPTVQTSDVAFQRKEGWRGQGKARAEAIAQGHLPPVRRAAPAKPTAALSHKSIENVAVTADRQIRSSQEADFANKSHDPELLLNDLVAGMAYASWDVPMPDLQEIEDYPNTASGLKSSSYHQARLDNLRTAEQKVRSNLHDLNAFQFGQLVKDKVLQEDFDFIQSQPASELSRKFASRKNAWMKKQVSHLTKHQTATSIREAEMYQIASMPSILALKPLPPKFDPAPARAPARSTPTGPDPRRNSTTTSFSKPIESPSASMSWSATAPSVSSPVRSPALQWGASGATQNPYKAQNSPPAATASPSVPNSTFSYFPPQPSFSTSNSSSSFGASSSWGTNVPSRSMPVPAPPAPVAQAIAQQPRKSRPVGAFPISRAEYEAMPAEEQVAVSVYLFQTYLHPQQTPATQYWLPSWAPEDVEVGWRAYLADPGMREGVKRVIESLRTKDVSESRRTKDPRKR